MGETHSLIGRIVHSTKGRDIGKSYLVLQEIDKDFVLLLDGSAHKMSNPKRKRKKHLEFSDITLENIKTKILNGSKIFDAEIYSNIRKVEISQEEMKED